MSSSSVRMTRTLSGCAPITTRRVAMKTPSLMLCVTIRMLFTGEVLRM